jgi:hypothetical protein
MPRSPTTAWYGTLHSRRFCPTVRGVVVDKRVDDQDWRPTSVGHVRALQLVFSNRRTGLNLTSGTPQRPLCSNRVKDCAPQRKSSCATSGLARLPHLAVAADGVRP